MSLAGRPSLHLTEAEVKSRMHSRDWSDPNEPVLLDLTGLTADQIDDFTRTLEEKLPRVAERQSR